MATKRRLGASDQAGMEAVTDDADANQVQITPLGAGSEVGRSCIILKYQ